MAEERHDAQKPPEGQPVTGILTPLQEDLGWMLLDDGQSVLLVKRTAEAGSGVVHRIVNRVPKSAGPVAQIARRLAASIK
jgi:hypothetical protein